MTDQPLISEAREKGFKKDTWVKVIGQRDLRKITHNRLNIEGDNILTTGPSPFFIRFRGRWIAEVMSKIN